MSYNLENGVAVVTGAASGIGRATAALFAEYGCKRLVLGDTNQSGLEQTRDEILKANREAQVEISKLDIREEASVKAFYDLAKSKFGRIDFGVNVAGVAHSVTRLVDFSSDEFERVFSINMRGTWLCERAMLSHMVEQDPLENFPLRGSIVNVTSIAATGCLAGLAAYSGTKGGILGTTRTDALDYGKYGIRVNAVAPGTTDTPMLAGALTPEHIKTNEGQVPMGRVGQPRDIANAIVWLSSPNAGYVNGVQLPVDGGRWMRTGP